MKTIAALALLILTAALPAAGQPSDILDLEDLNKTMVTLEKGFETKNAASLRVISHPSLLKSRSFDTLLSFVDCCRLSSAYSTRVARQEFDVDGGRLTADFSYRDEKWFLESVTVNNRSLAPRGFDALASEYHFSDFRAAVLGGKIHQYAGLRFSTDMAKKPFLPKADTTVTVLNLLVHDGKTPRELLYVRLRKIPEVREQRRGWLIEDVGSMLSYARRQSGANPLIEFLTNRDSYFDLTKPSAFAFINVRASEVSKTTARLSPPPASELNLKAGAEKPATHTVKRIVTRDFQWSKEGTSFTIAIELAGDACCATEWTSKVIGNSLQLETSPDVILTGDSEHTYLDVRAEQNTLVIGIRRGIDSPVPRLTGARVRKIAVSTESETLRITADLLLPRD